MPRVICTRPNASLNISGVSFQPTEDGMAIISEEISEEQAENFLLIPGYELGEEDHDAALKKAEKEAKVAQEKLDKAAATKAAKEAAGKGAGKGTGKGAGKDAAKGAATAPKAADKPSAGDAGAKAPAGSETPAGDGAEKTSEQAGAGEGSKAPGAGGSSEDETIF